ncbi:hypothetical protein L0F63_006662, partial [Massospora cicadina]
GASRSPGIQMAPRGPVPTGLPHQWMVHPERGMAVQPCCTVNPLMLLLQKAPSWSRWEDHHQQEPGRGCTTQPSAGRASMGQGGQSSCAGPYAPLMLLLAKAPS